MKKGAGNNWKDMKSQRCTAQIAVVVCLVVSLHTDLNQMET